MPRPSDSSAVPSVHKNPPVQHPSGHTIIVYADNAVWNETLQKFITPEQLTRKG